MTDSSFCGQNLKNSEQFHKTKSFDSKDDNNCEGICINVSLNLNKYKNHLHFKSDVTCKLLSFPVFVYKSETLVFTF